MKKIIALLLAVLTVFTLASCNKKDKNGDGSDGDGNNGIFSFEVATQNLKNAGLIDSAVASYSTILNAVAVNTTYENLEKISARDDVESVILSDTFNRPKESSSTAIENIVDIYETGILSLPALIIQV